MSPTTLRQRSRTACPTPPSKRTSNHAEHLEPHRAPVSRDHHLQSVEQTCRRPAKLESRRPSGVVDGLAVGSRPRYPRGSGALLAADGRVDPNSALAGCSSSIHICCNGFACGAGDENPTRILSLGPISMSCVVMRPREILKDDGNRGWRRLTVFDRCRGRTPRARREPRPSCRIVESLSPFMGTVSSSRSLGTAQIRAWNSRLTCWRVLTASE